MTPIAPILRLRALDPLGQLFAQRATAMGAGRGKGHLPVEVGGSLL